MNYAVTVALLLGLTLGTPAAALTVQNEDEEAHTVTVKQDGIATKLVIGAGETQELTCEPACELHLASGDHATFENNVDVIINNGTLSIAE